jgi:hypothetical protein
MFKLLERVKHRRSGKSPHFFQKFCQPPTYSQKLPLWVNIHQYEQLIMITKKIAAIAMTATTMMVSTIMTAQAQTKAIALEKAPEVSAVDVAADQDDTDPDDQLKSSFKKALTWKVAKTQIVNGKTYVLMSHNYANDNDNHVSNPYTGDTPINRRRSLLCLKKSAQPTPAPAGLTPLNVTTPGGALSNSWSSAKMIAIPNVLGSDLTSRAVADQKCKMMGLLVYGQSGYRMAEFHDGQAGANPGWSYWVEGYSVREGLDKQGHYWVAIKDQPANPW